VIADEFAFGGEGFQILTPANKPWDGLDVSDYLDDDCIVNIALLVKAYVNAALGPDSQLYKSINGIELKRPNK
jgi:hypothetical protein